MRRRVERAVSPERLPSPGQLMPRRSISSTDPLGAPCAWLQCKPPGPSRSSGICGSLLYCLPLLNLFFSGAGLLKQWHACAAKD
jgi:hypothetical protein